VEEAKAGILAALFSAVSAGLATQEDVKLDGLPRMADVARWGTATEQSLGGEGGSFMEAYTASQEEAVETALESWPIVETLWEFAKGFEGDDGAWLGTATELFNTLNEKAEDDLKRAKDWPKQPNKLTEQLNRLAPSLVEVGVYVVRLPSHKGGRKLKVFCVNTPRK
jgi:putative DNA primase/helicase